METSSYALRRIFIVMCIAFVSMTCAFNRAQTLVNGLDVRLFTPVTVSLEPELPLDYVLFVITRSDEYDVTLITRDLSDIIVTVPNNITSVGELILVYAQLYNLCAYSQSTILAVFPRTEGEPCYEGNAGELDSGNTALSLQPELVDNVPNTGPALAQAQEQDNGTVSTEASEPLLDGLQPDSSEATGASETGASKGTYRIRFTVAQINEQKAASLGINWNGEAFQTVAQLVLGSQYIFSGYFPQPDFDKLFDFLEREGVAMREDSLELFAVDGEGVSYNRGGSLNVQLVSGGAENIQTSFQYGLTVNVTVTRLENDTLLFNYDYADVDPGNTSDPTFINLANTSTSSSAIVKCGSTVIISSLFTRREEGQGEGLPQFSRVPALGYVGGTGTDSQNRSSYIIAVTVNCPEVAS
jgi:hypothetical protein